MSQSYTRKILSFLFCGSVLLGFANSASSEGTCSQATYRNIKAANALMEQNKPAAAKKRLLSLLSGKLKSRDRAHALRSLAYVHFDTQNYKQAIEAFEGALSLNSLPKQLQLSMRYDLSQMHLAAENYRKAVTILEPLLTEMPKPSPHAYMTLGYSLSRLGSYEKALPYVEKAIRSAKKPMENCYRLLVALYHEMHRGADAALVLEKMLRVFPDKKLYWQQLASLYLSLGKQSKAAAVLEMADSQGLLEKESELRHLPISYLLLGAPNKAAVFLEAKLDDGTLSRSDKNLRLLYSAWLHAKERSRAIEVLQEAAKKAGGPELFFELARLANDEADYELSVSAAKTALKKGLGKESGQAHLLIASSYHELEKNTEALLSLKKARNFKDTEDDANKWIVYLENLTTPSVPALTSRINPIPSQL